MPHAAAASALASELGGPFQQGRDGPGGWWILDEPELHLGIDVVAVEPFDAVPLDLYRLWGRTAPAT